MKDRKHGIMPSKYQDLFFGIIITTTGMNYTGFLLLFLVTMEQTRLMMCTSNDKFTREAEKDDNDMGDKLRKIAFWLRQHKFYEIDQRYALSKRQQEGLSPYFVQSFPKPRLRQLSEPLARLCRISVEDCINEIYSSFTLTPFGRIMDSDDEYKKNLKQRFADFSSKTRRVIQYKPFKNKLKLFQFRATASYFMCYYTLHRNASILEHFGCDTNTGSVDPRTAKNYYGEKNTDYRADESTEYSCAEYSFCPDVCCGKINGEWSSQHFWVLGRGHLLFMKSKL